MLRIVWFFRYEILRGILVSRWFRFSRLKIIASVFSFFSLMYFTLCLGEEKVEEKENKVENLGLVAPVNLVSRRVM